MVFNECFLEIWKIPASRCQDVLWCLWLMSVKLWERRQGSPLWGYLGPQGALGCKLRTSFPTGPPPFNSYRFQHLKKQLDSCFLFTNMYISVTYWFIFSLVLQYFWQLCSFPVVSRLPCFTVFLEPENLVIAFPTCMSYYPVYISSHSSHNYVVISTCEI